MLWANMNCTAMLTTGLVSMMWTAAALSQSTPTSAPSHPQYAAVAHTPDSAPQGSPVSYASVSQLNSVLTQLESASKTTQVDLQKLRIEHWKADKSSKQQALENVESIQRNLQGALPEIISQLRGAPEDLSASFKLYRNLDALYDVLGNVVELTGAFGSKDDAQSLGNDLNNFEGGRKQMASRIETLSSAKEAEITRLRAELKTAQAAIPAEPPKKIVVDDTEPPKKPAAKKKTTTKPKTTTPPSAKTAAGQSNPQQPQ